ncbi:hypothetical protein TWF106_006803 [Orbilia oligospora]|uniref:Uncharacterized protein n=1 Tax=Orbilia oligospora TaxID=2813651 RepID=A0A7C8U2X4_ORBOL|nr:hypothetical protein TWF106_006803 [Orbilia oligospora]
MGDEKVVELLLKYGAQLDFEDEGNQTPLSRAIDESNVSIVQLLLDRGAKVNYRYTRTPLSRAAETGDEKVVELLLKYGAQLDFEDDDNQTPLSRAVQEGNARIIQLLTSRRTS